MTCCNGIAKSLVEEDREEEVRSQDNELIGFDWCTNISQALEWFEEVDVLYKNARFGTRPPLFDWVDYYPKPAHIDFLVQRVTALAGASDIFLGLGNTGSATHRRVVADDIINNLPPVTDATPLNILLPEDSVRSLMQYRHPDPDIHADHELTNDALQVLGSWQKIKLSKHIAPRMGFVSFIWRSRLYVGGGIKSGTFNLYSDMWCLDLKKLNGWRELPPYPRGGGACLNLQMAVHETTAYVFNGTSVLTTFDLITETWGQLRTGFVDSSGNPGPWPLADKNLSDYSMQIVRGRLYVFGGSTKNCKMGCNFFAVLNLATRVWEHLSGAPGLPAADYDCPGPRKYLGSWVDEKDERIYVLQGMADLAASKMFNQPHAADHSYGYDDLWSWDIKGRRWRRERLVGNAPCPRTEMACTFNPRLNATLVYGGYNPGIPTLFESMGICFSFTYFADTYILNHSSSKPVWKQVLTQGFPTYRAQSTLLTDPDTGRMYLFGGYTNTDLVPSRSHARTRSFGDLWQLRVDIPGGHFEEVNISEEERNARVGPWQKCFTCGNVGPWKKCGGTCRGRAFFCDDQCLKEGWQEHKQIHTCKKNQKVSVFDST